MRRWSGAFGAAVAGALVAVGGIGAPPAHAEELQPVERFASCINGGGQGNVLMLIDTSGSLFNTDPDAGRVKAASATVTRLAESLTDVPGEVDVAVAGFGTTFEPSLGWTPLTADNLGTINGNLDQFANKIDGVDTDYWTAMDGVRREFSARAQDQKTPCNLLMWFSDGEFNLNQRANDSEMQKWGGPKAWVPDNRLRTEADIDAALTAGRNDLCRAGGLADQLRSLDIITIGIGLAVDSPPESFELMQGISTGAGCGENTSPTPGEFIMATGVDDLIYDFITAINTGEGGENKPCVDAECPEGTRTFVLDGSIGAVNATAKAPVDGTRIYLKTRSGENIELTQGTGERDLGGSTLTWEWVTPRVLTLDLTRESPDNWAGPWGIVFVADEQSDELARSSITLKGDISPVLVNRDQLDLRIGEAPAELQLGTVDRLGQRIDPATLSDQTVLGVKLISGGETTQLASGLVKADMEDPIELDLDGFNPGVAELVLTLDVTTQSWEEGGTTIPGTRLEPRHASIPLNILPPADFPTLPDKVSFGHTETADPVTIQVPLEGAGCAWLSDETRFTGYPEGLGDAKLTSPATDRASCTSGSLELTLDPGGLGNGSFIGSTRVTLAAADSSAEPVVADLAFDLSQSRPASQPVLWSTLILITLLGVAIPVAILYLVKFLTSKIPGTAVLAGSAYGPVDDAHAFTDNGVPLNVANLTVAHLTNNRREVTVAGKTLKAKMGAAPTEPGYVVVDTPGPSAGGRTSLQSVGGNARLPLAVQGNWMVALDPQRPVGGAVEVTVFTAPGSPGFSELLEDVRANIRTAVAKLRAGLPPEQGAPSADPWAGGGGTPTPAADPWAGGGASAPTGDQWAQPTNPTVNDPWANPPGGQRPTGGPNSW
ncbi:von Willebrand factor type A domain-containing protein [Tessaracoccus bendigoensis DSM 12906]|uniref:von Willebrand factor type A domain-containing protein n=1 Tax=Tessaracoccus bendigoensis DSM 12906 TaxID=1123357 RepID=A0A1M6EPY9_9ACTN|nr:vWA domain-containing protein [Tessaracoccus bendigoensis]SHI87617.1 von Willebrand factor type A domain-containing protein [Tessaracoccus bendigoensis DSM 12906]